MHSLHSIVHVDLKAEEKLQRKLSTHNLGERGGRSKWFSENLNYNPDFSCAVHFRINQFFATSQPLSCTLTYLLQQITSYFQAIFSEDSRTALSPHTSIFLLWNLECAQETRWEIIMPFLPGLESLPASFFKNKEVHRCCSTNLEHSVLCERFSQLSPKCGTWLTQNDCSVPYTASATPKSSLWGKTWPRTVCLKSPRCTTTAVLSVSFSAGSSPFPCWMEQCRDSLAPCSQDAVGQAGAQPLGCSSSSQSSPGLFAVTSSHIICRSIHSHTNTQLEQILFSLSFFLFNFSSHHFVPRKTKLVSKSFLNRILTVVHVTAMKRFSTTQYCTE